MSQISEDPFYAQIEQELSKLIRDDDHLPHEVGIHQKFFVGEEGEKRKQPSLDSGFLPDGSREERTMFITFSRGYRVIVRELKDFFISNFGDCIEQLHMQPVPLGEQSLYAVLVTRSPEKVAEILNGQEKARFIVNGKHVWARPYVRRQHRLFARATITTTS